MTTDNQGLPQDQRDSEARELKPCPFCGGTPEVVRRDVEPQGDPWYGDKEETFVLCGCGACLFDGSFHEGFGSDKSARTDAIAAWNARPAPEALGAAKGELSDAWERFAAWLLDHCEGQVITEEFLQEQMQAMLNAKENGNG